jgi:hypothetical protein
MSVLNTILTEEIPDQNVAATRRAQFAQANASEALEGLVMSADDLAIQERVVNGEITPDQAIALYVNAARKGA